jgi:hypothetical protein
MVAPPPPALVEALLAARAPGLAPTARAALLACPRVAARVRALAIAAAPPATARLAHAAAERALLLAGAGLHAAAVLALLRGPELAALVGALGLDPRAAAMACTGTARPAPRPVGEAELAAAIRSDGAACLSGWALALPPADALAQWAVLPAAARDAAPHPDGPAIVARLLAEALL